MSTAMERRQFLQALGMASASLALTQCGGSQPQDQTAAQLPNIIFLMADDMGYGDLGCFNPDSKIPTPNMDRLAAEGMRFTDAHSGSAVCTPTRYGVVTGRYCWRTELKSGVLSGYSKSLIDPNRMTVASMLGESGYHTGVVGKWHLGLDWVAKQGAANSGTEDDTAAAYQSMDEFAKPEGLEVDFTQPVKIGPKTYGFDYSYIFPASLDMAPYVYVENNQSVADADDHTEGMADGGTFWRKGEMMQGFDFPGVLPTLTEKAVGFIDEHAKSSPEQPFFLYFPLAAPHWPWLPTDEVKGTSGAGKYGDFVALVDKMVGRVMEALDRNQMAQNTLFIMTSDNGAEWDPPHIEEFGHHANHPNLRGKKRDAWDGGHRIPFIARWPEKIAAGTTSDQIICLTDLMGTAAAIAGVELPDNAGEDSYSILPVLLGEARGQIREATIHHSVEGMFAIRQGKWKFIDGQGPGSSFYGKWAPKPEDPPGQLYDMSADIGEQTNLYDQHPEVVARLKALLEKYKQQGHSRPA